MSAPSGVVLTQAPSDWQIIQQDVRGKADIPLAGRCHGLPEDKRPQAYLRLVREDSGAPVAAHLDWQPAAMRRDGTWSAVLRHVPAGGLYRLETQMRTELVPCPEWAKRGDMRHCLGVGEVWIIAGQSNSAGYGKGHIHDPPELGLHLFDNACRWTLATQPLNESTDTAHPANRETANPGHSPWLHWARLVKQALNCPVGLIQCSLGGSALRPWNPTEPGPHPLYDTLRQAVAQAAGARPGGVRGVLWYQGCSDTGAEETARTYLRRFSGMVRAWRKALRCPRLAFVTVQINRVTEPRKEDESRRWSIVREAQRLAAHRLPRVTVTPTLDLGLSDFVHTSPAGNLVLAERAATAALGAVYARPLAWRAPEAVSARRSADGLSIELTFAHVTGRFRHAELGAQPFRVEDRQGPAQIEKIEYTGGPLVRLMLARPLSGPAVVHGGYGHDPEPVPVDMTRNLPMLGFFGLRVS